MDDHLAETGFSTRAIHAGQGADPATGSTVVPIYATSTFTQEAPGRHKGYEYSRSGNPTRTALETLLSTSAVRAGISSFAVVAERAIACIPAGLIAVSTLRCTFILAEVAWARLILVQATPVLLI